MEPKVLPILMSPAMARATLEGRKRQTRRIITPQPTRQLVQGKGDARCWFEQSHYSPEWVCPYGKLGDHLWVREEHFRLGHWESEDGERTKIGRRKWRFVADSDQILFDNPTGLTIRKSRHPQDFLQPAWHKRIARFMPRRAARISLEITGVRVERLQAISIEDIKAEGIDNDPKITSGALEGMVLTETGLRHVFEELWDSINGERGEWASNPWVWVVEFEVVSVVAIGAGLSATAE